MSKINELNEKLIKVLEEKIQLLEEQKAINEKIIEIQKEQLFLCGVVGQSEQLKPKQQICYKSNEPCKCDCSGLCKESY